MSTAIIVQARMGSKRFPGKVMADLCGRPVLWHVLTRCLQIKLKDRVILAMPQEPESAPLKPIAGLLGVDTYFGPENDVLARYLGAARHFEADLIVRITADCPLIDPELCDQVIALAKQMVKEIKDPQAGIYVSNVYPEATFEQGLACQVFTRRTLEMADRHATLPRYREHVCPWMEETGRVLKGSITSNDPKRARTNWCVDYPEDIARLERIMECA